MRCHRDPNGRTPWQDPPTTRTSDLSWSSSVRARRAPQASAHSMPGCAPRVWSATWTIQGFLVAPALACVRKEMELGSSRASRWWWVKAKRALEASLLSFPSIAARAWSAMPSITKCAGALALVCARKEMEMESSRTGQWWWAKGKRAPEDSHPGIPSVAARAWSAMPSITKCAGALALVCARKEMEMESSRTGQWWWAKGKRAPEDSHPSIPSIAARVWSATHKTRTCAGAPALVCARKAMEMESSRASQLWWVKGKLALEAFLLNFPSIAATA
mmetsp:Transcript_116323/g.301553  ORF Transcript_116323/g.301553 Transcript_116323/m.301553 type:complete len:275 (+) Transcript_116323:234-1058(+)